MKHTTFETLTVGQYQKLFAIHTGNAEDMDKIIQSVCVLTGLTEEEVDGLPVPEFNKISKEILVIFKEQAFSSSKAKPKTFINIGGKQFGVIYNPATLSTGQYIEVQTWMRSNLIENLHKIVASIVYPVKGWWIFKNRLKYNPDIHTKISEQIKDCNFLDVHNACVFFLKLWRNSMIGMKGFLEKELKAKGISQNQVEILLRHVSDGFLTPNELQTLRT